MIIMELNTTTLAIFALFAALGVVGVLVIVISAQPPTKGCRTSVAVNASEARCFHGDR
jgi:hypothetical protein